MTAQIGVPPTIRQHIQSILSDTFRSRAVQVFIALWVIAALVLLAYGHAPWGGLAQLLGIAAFMLITALYTQPNPPSIESDPAERRKLYIQLAVLAGLILLTAFGGMQYHGLVPNDASIPLWTPMVNAVERFSGQTFGNDNYISNPVQYFVIPVILLLLLGAKLPDLGFGRGHRVLRVTLIWCIVPVLAIIYLLFSGALLSWVGQMLLLKFTQQRFLRGISVSRGAANPSAPPHVTGVGVGAASGALRRVACRAGLRQLW